LSIVEAIVLGLVQGLTEFIPISSTAHLRIVPELLGWRDPGAAASAVIQLGTLLAVLIYFARDVVELTGAFFRGLASRRPLEEEKSRLAWLIIVGSIPVVILGLTFKDFIETGARSLWIVASSLIAIALLLMAAEAYSKRVTKRVVGDLRMLDAVIIGFGQALALIPGMSRSGSTIMTGLFRRLDHAAAARFSFLLSIPAILGSGLFELVAEWDHLAELGWLPIAIAIAVSFVSGWASIWFLLLFLKTHTTHVFAWYRIALGITLIVMLARGVLEPMSGV
jgi:undecaprenyl-diphosphatase